MTQSVIAERPCNKCKEVKHLTEFTKLAVGPQGYNYHCKKCHVSYHRVASAKYRKSNVKNIRETNTLRRRTRVAWLRETKRNKPCVDCNKIYEPYFMDYDHLHSKIKNVSRMALDNTPMSVIKTEIAKCELVCVWCHYTRTHERLKKKFNNDGFPKNTNRREKAMLTWKLRDVPCGVCLIKYQPYQMQFDHLPAFIKIDDVTKLVNLNRSIRVILAEVKKCQIICCGCHRTKSLQKVSVETAA